VFEVFIQTVLAAKRKHCFKMMKRNTQKISFFKIPLGSAILGDIVGSALNYSA
jgi:hypothetical protein